MLRVGDCELEIRIQYKLERNKLKLKLSDCSELYQQSWYFTHLQKTLRVLLKCLKI